MNFTDGRIHNTVKRHETQMVLQDVQFFVDVGELAPPNIDLKNEGGYVEWRGDRGWFDQCVKIVLILEPSNVRMRESLTLGRW